MFRKILIATVASLSLLSPLALPTESQAREAHHRNYHGNHGHYGRHGHARHAGFRVYYRSGNRGAWRFAGSYGVRGGADSEACLLRSRGFEVIIR